ncbi:pantetheine-phosphate adenylyltransferase [Mycoplasma sp. ATU-Cv-703]|uniref:pantetheine-phosphate adenylyltransferase n=1 Tax=Mycoplasma sp. ATU-Cv-703 TaxID=2498595 RepID=UPI000FDDF711
MAKFQTQRAILAGSFDPWHEGHQSVLEAGLEIFTQVIVLVANNPAKKQTPMSLRLAQVQKKVRHPRAVVKSLTQGYVADFARQAGINFLIRGVRGDADWNYERELSLANQKINPDLKTIFFLAKPEQASLSSSALRPNID